MGGARLFQPGKKFKMDGQKAAKMPRLDNNSSDHFPHFATTAIHVGQDPDRWTSKAVVPLISLSTTFKQESPGKPVSS